jgi:GTP-binding protein of the ras superfamily involved in termination of M-phase
MDSSQIQEAEPACHIQQEQEQEPNSSPNVGGIALQEAPGTNELPVTSPTYSNGYSNGERDHHHPLSTDYASSTQNYLPQQEDDQSSRFNPPATMYQPQPPQSTSRPGSGLSSGGDKYAYSQAYPDQTPKQQAPQTKNSVVIKVGMVGDAQIGKTSLMVKYVEGSWDEDYIQTLGVNFMEKTISIRNTEITFSIWDLGGQREFVNMLPLVCNDAVAILFMFDLTRKSTLNSIKEWYRQGRGFNKTAIPFLIGTKYDHFVNFPREDQEEISVQAKRFAKAMKASLIFSSTSHSINVQKIFKIVLSKAFDLKCTIPEIENTGEPLLLYKTA